LVGSGFAASKAADQQNKKAGNREIAGPEVL
jgi:hypothetical protein